MAYLTISLQFIPTKLLIVSNNNSSSGSLKLKPYVIFGLVKSLANYAVVNYTIFTIYLWKTRYAIRLHIQFQRILSYPIIDFQGAGSYFKQVMFQRIIQLDYLYTTFDITTFRRDFASKYYCSFCGQIFLRTRNPRTRPCILRSRGKVSFIINLRVLLSLYFYFSVLVTTYIDFGCNFDELTTDKFSPSDLSPAMASSDRLLLSFILICFDIIQFINCVNKSKHKEKHHEVVIGNQTYNIIERDRLLLYSRMGAICHHKQQSLRNYTTKQCSIHASTQTYNIKVSTRNINKTGEKCLLLFVDTQCNVQRNQYLSDLKSNVSMKMQEYLDVQIKGKCMNPGDCLVLSVLIQNLKFTQVGILCINVWGSCDKGLNDPLQDDIEQAIEAIKKKNIDSICMTDFNTQLGVPRDIGNKTLSRAILNHISDLKSVTIACLKQEYQNGLVEAVKHEQTKCLGEKLCDSLVGSIKSQYY